MGGVLQQSVLESGGAAFVLGVPTGPPASTSSHRAAKLACFHCGEPCSDPTLQRAEKMFCCQGCLLVHELLTENGLEQFYGLNPHPGVRIRPGSTGRDWSFLDERALQARLLDFTDGKTSRVTFHIPAIHCIACVWLLENLFRLLPGVGQSQVNFPRREVAIRFAPAQVKLSQVVSFLVSIGYEPELNLGRLDSPKAGWVQHKLWLQIGVAGFAFGNIMLFSLPAYLGLDQFSGPTFRALFGWLSLVLALPVLFYCASDYWRSAWLTVRQRRVTLEVPIVLGLLALYGRSAYEVVSGLGQGYADSLAGLVFFLLCGRAFQQKTHERLAFDRDYKSFFPLSVLRITDDGEERIALADLGVGNRLRLRNGELIPADSRLRSGSALIDYSFVTGESEPVEKKPGYYLYAGGKQVGGAIELETLKPVSQSYLTSLWNHEAFQKERSSDFDTLTNRYSRRFTGVVISVACAAALFWTLSGDSGRGLKAFTSVLIVACPCALALAAPFAFGTGQRLLGKVQVYLKNSRILEDLAAVDAVVFDKTGTLTSLQSEEVGFHSCAAAHPTALAELNPTEQLWVRSVARHSTHPHARQIAASLAGLEVPDLEVLDFSEVPASGLKATVAGHQIHLGSRAWLEQQRVDTRWTAHPSGSSSCLAIDGQLRGAFVLTNPLRPETERLFRHLSERYELALLSGDHERERARFAALFGQNARLRFNQSPLDKLGFIRALQEAGKTVAMVGDGLNDAGALRQSDVGVAVVEKVGTFSPASDIILEARQVSRLGQILGFARQATRIVRVSLGISAVYNLVGVSFAAAGLLSPLICAVLMPLSSLTVVVFACGMTAWAAKRAEFDLIAP